MGAYTIRELEKLSGIKAHTIRIWEKRYGLITPQRTSTNIRTYCDGDLKKLLNVSLLNRTGIKISTIAKLSHEEIVERINEISDETGMTENQIEHLAEAMIDFDEYNFEQVLAKSIIHLGFEETVVKILYPFLKKIGLMWQTGRINPAHEHFITSLVRQKFFVAIDGLIGSSNNPAKYFLFFLPEGEQHEIGLLFLSYLVKKRGHNVIYLGQSVPIIALQEVVHMKKVDYLVTSLTTPANGADHTAYINDLADKFSDKIIFVGGSQADHMVEILPSNVKLINSPAGFQNELYQIEPIHSVN